MNKPRFLDRLRYTWNFWRHGTRYMSPRRAADHASRAIFTWADVGQGREEKDAPFIWPDWRLGKPQWQIVNYQAYAQEGFNENAVIYSAIMYKVESITIAPLRAYGGTMDEPKLLPADHPLQQLVSRPNPYMSWCEFQGLAEVYLNLAGNCYVYVDREGEDVPKALYLLRPDLMRIVPSPRKKRELLGFLYVPEGKSEADGVPFLPEQIMHVKLPNPLDPMDGLGYGLSPVSPMARSADVDNQVTKYLKLFFDKGAIPPGLLKFDVPLDEAEVAAARERFMEIYGSSENWWKVAVLDQGGEYQRLALNFDEMGFEEIDERNESRICGPFGVPPIIIGTRLGLRRATYANYELARRAFWQDQMTPELRWFETEYQYYLQGASGEFVMFDLSKVPALMPTTAERFEAARDAFRAGGIMRNEYRAVIGFDPLSDGDVYLIPMTIIEVPAGEKPKPPTEEGMPEAQEEAEEEEKALKQSRMNAEQKAAFWKQMDAQATAWEGRFGEAAVEALRGDLREILAIIGKAKAKALEDKATIAWGLALLSVQDYLKMEAADSWRKAFVPVIQGLIIERGNQLNVDFGMEFDVTNLFAERWFEDYTLTFAQPINETTEGAMSALFQQAMAEGWSVPTMQSHLEQVFRQWMEGDLSADDFEWFEQRIPAHRREMIARTETIRASNAGSEALYRDWGVQTKEWLSTMDARTRDTHLEANGQVVPINAAFDVGGESLRFPGDPQGSPENTINCRCTVLAVI